MFKSCTIFLLFFFLSPLSTSQDLIPYPDNSPSLQDFRKMGVPNENDVWTINKYQQAFNILDQIYNTDKFSMPRLHSTYSGRLFKRMIAIENTNYLLDPSINIGKRILAFEKWKEIPPRILLYYIEDDQAEERFSAEVIECYFLETYLFDVGLKLYDEMKIQLGARANSGQFQIGYQQLQLSFNKKIEQLFFLIETNYHRYGKNDLVTLVNKLFFLLPKINNEEYRKQLKIRIKLLEKQLIDSNLRKIFQELRQEL